MGNNPSVSFKTEVIAPTEGLPYLSHALITFRPSTTAFLNAFIASTQPWMFPSPATNEGLVAQFTPNNWQSRLKALGATSTEPLWRALDAHFKQLAVADSTGVRGDVPLPDVVYVGRRTSSVVSRQTVEFSTNTAGTVRVRINQAKFIHASDSPAGSLADVTITADGVLTPTALATALAAALNAVTGFAALYSAAAALGVVTITSLVAGYPLVVDVAPSTPGPTMILAVTTANVAGAYETDLDEMQEAFETGSQLDPPARRAYWITDLQGDDTVGAEGMQWVEDQADTAQHNPPRDYQFCAWSTTGGRTIENSGGDLIGNFDPNATDSLAQTAVAANGGAGFTRGSVHSHDRWEFMVCGLLGRTIASLPGAVSFTDKVLYGSTANARMSPRDYGDNESLADDRRFNWYGAEGPRGSAHYGYTPSAEVGFMDRKWLEDYCTYQASLDVGQWKRANEIIAYSTPTIEAGAGIIRASLTKLPGIDSNSIRVSFLTRAQVDPNNIAERIYTDYSAFAVSFDVINKIGTLANPINITINATG